MHKKLTFLGIAAVLFGAVVYLYFKPPDVLQAKLDTILAVRPEQVIECAALKQQRPLVLLALGQSNAGNHGALAKSVGEPVAVVAGSTCAHADDPLPGATGSGGSVWHHLPALLGPELAGRKVVLSVVAVDATTIDDWTRSRSSLAKRLSEQIAALHALGLPPDLVLWQQGEADARDNTGTDDYLHSLNRLAALLDGLGVRAPVLLARSTVCRSQPSAPIRQAMAQAVASHGQFVLGPDTDLLLGDAYRRDGCHFNENGLRQAALAWALAIKPLAASGGKVN